MSDTATGPWREALGIIDTLLTEQPAARERLLADLAATRPDLHSRVRALLDADAEATRTGFLRVPAPAMGLAAGARLGPYRIEREIGSGGMGEVWLARRDDGLYQGEVALKTLHPYFAHGAMRERFLREAQLLGKLAHPNIARLLDAGVSDGVVYLVLEYVRGRSLDDYCDERKLDIEARLALFGDVCAAVAHAHANLVVHRDIKPANILVTDEGQVKLLDFGIGKLVEAEGAERTELTRVTGRIFTPEFAAPEQVAGEPVTTATDVYSLGALLYVLLCGVRPFGDLTGTKVERAVLHDDPPAPSDAARSAPPDVALNRGASPARLPRLLAGDLDDIAALAMRKAPRERYGSVQALADDVARHVRHEPVIARAGSRAYRFGRFVRRHRVAVAASAGVFVAAAAGVAGVLYQAREAREQARLAQIEAVKATSVKDFLLQIFKANSTSNPDGVAARKTTAEELMNIATREILADDALDPAVRLDLMSTLGNIQAQMDKIPEQEGLIQARIALAEQKFGAGDIRLADAYNDLGEFLRTRGRREEAIAAVNKALALRDAQRDSESWTRGVSELVLGQITVGEWDAQDDVPIDHFRKSIAILAKLPPSHEYVRANLGLARAYEFKDDYPHAIEYNEKGIALAIAIDGPKSLGVGGGHQQLARVLAYSYRLPESERHLEQAVEVFTFIQGKDGGFTLNALLDVGRMKIRRGQQHAAVEMLEPLLARRLSVDGPDTSWVRNIRNALANGTLAIGDFPRTKELLDANRASAAKQKSLVNRAYIERVQATLANEERRHDDALRFTDDGLAMIRQTPQARSDAAYYLLMERVEALAGLGRVDDARAAVAELTPMLAEFDQDPDRFDTLRAQLAQARVALAAKDADAARTQLGDTLRKLQASARRGDAWTLEDSAQRRLAEVELAAGNANAACAAADESIRLRTAHALPTDPRLIAAKKIRSRCTA